MNYYDETIDKIKNLIDQKEYEKAKRLILNELDLPYVPKDFEDKLNELLLQVKQDTYKPLSLSDEEIINYLNMDESHQLIGVDALNRRNLRDYIDICENYLSKPNYANGKALLIDSLISQQIDHEFIYKDDNREVTFNPIKILPVEENDTYIECYKRIQDIYMKEPSIIIMANQLLYKEFMMKLPETFNKEDIDTIINKIVAFIEDAFK